jgi:hypothetical protein
LAYKRFRIQTEEKKKTGSIYWNMVNGEMQLGYLQGNLIQKSGTDNVL